MSQTRPKPWKWPNDAKIAIAITVAWEGWSPGVTQARGDVFGEKELGRVMPLKTALGLGMKVQGNSDYPCSPMNPFLHLRSAVARQTRAGNILDPREAITVDEAHHLMTTGAAYAGFEEYKRGTLELGKLADLIVLSEDPYEVPPESLECIHVDKTIVGGEIVFERTA